MGGVAALDDPQGGALAATMGGVIGVFTPGEGFEPIGTVPISGGAARDVKILRDDDRHLVWFSGLTSYESFENGVLRQVTLSDP